VAVVVCQSAQQLESVALNQTAQELSLTQHATLTSTLTQPSAAGGGWDTVSYEDLVDLALDGPTATPSVITQVHAGH